MAHQQDGPASHEQQAADSNTQPVPPTHVVLDPSPNIENLKAKASYQEQASKAQPVSHSARAEWITVIINGLYAFMSGGTLVAVYKQVGWSKKQAKLMEDQLTEMSRQTT